MEQEQRTQEQNSNECLVEVIGLLAQCLAEREALDLPYFRRLFEARVSGWTRRNPQCAKPLQRLTEILGEVVKWHA
jgi:hypothetical protein